MKRLLSVLFLLSTIVACNVDSASDVKKDAEKIHDEVVEEFTHTMKKVNSSGIGLISFSRVELLKTATEAKLEKVKKQGKFKGGEALYNALVNELNYVIGTCTELLKVEKDEDLQFNFNINEWMYRAKNGLSEYENHFIDAFNNYNTKVGNIF